MGGESTNILIKNLGSDLGRFDFANISLVDPLPILWGGIGILLTQDQLPRANARITQGGMNLTSTVGAKSTSTVAEILSANVYCSYLITMILENATWILVVFYLLKTVFY